LPKDAPPPPLLGLAAVDKFPFPEFHDNATDLLGDPTTLDESLPIVAGRPFSPIADPLNGAFEGVHLSDLSSGELLDVFTNGFDEPSMRTGVLHKPVVMTANRRSAFHESTGWTPSSNFHSLPYVWQMKTKKRHFVKDLIYANTVVANELGFASPLDYVKSRGWTFTLEKGVRTLQYKTILEPIMRKAPSGTTAELQTHFMAMIDRLYEIIKGDGIKDCYKGMDMVRFLNKTSLVRKLHNYAREYQYGVIIVERYFVPYAKHHCGDTAYWFCRVFSQCRKHKDYALLIDNLFSLILAGDFHEVATDLMEKYPDCIRDEANRRARRMHHNSNYHERLDSMLGDVKYGTRSKGHTPEMEFLFACCSARDNTYTFLDDKAKEKFVSSTRKTKKPKSKKRGSADGELLIGRCCAVRFTELLFCLLTIAVFKLLC